MSSLGRIIFEVARSHTVGQTHLVGIYWTSNQLVAKANTYATYNKNKGRTYVPSAGFEPIILPIKRPETYTSDRAASLETFKDQD